jgi:hypothetical protein
MAQAQKQDFAFRQNGRVHLTLSQLTWRIWWVPNNASKWQMGLNSAFKGLNRRGRQFSRLLAAKLCATAVVMLGTPSSEVVWRVLATHSIRQFPLHFPSHASPCAITFQLDLIYIVRPGPGPAHRVYINPLNAELNPICHFLILLGVLTFMGPCIVSIFQYISNKMQTLHSLFISGNCSTCFGRYFRPSSGAHTTVSTASGICRTVTAICRYRGRFGTGLSGR